MDTYDVNRLISFSNRGKGLGLKLLNLYPAKSDVDFPIQFSSLDLCDGITTNLESVEILLNKLQSKQYLEYSIGLLLRSNLFDYIQLLYLHHKSSSNEESIYAFLSLQWDHMGKTKSYLNSLKVCGAENPEMIEDLQRKLEEKFSSFRLTKEQIPKWPTTKDMFEVLIKLPQYQNLIRESYDNYKHYSQYEHYGLFTHYKLRQESKLLLKGIEKSLFYSVRGIQLCSSFLDKEDLVKEADALLKEYQNS